MNGGGKRRKEEKGETWKKKISRRLLTIIINDYNNNYFCFLRRGGRMELGMRRKKRTEGKGMFQNPKNVSLFRKEEEEETLEKLIVDVDK